MNDLGHAHHLLATTPPVAVHASTSHGDPSFHFGWSNSIHSIRVSTFSGLDRDCSYEQFRYNVNCLINQGAPEGMILMTIKWSIKGQMQEIVLHMADSASVKDILSWLEMMFGDVETQHILLAQFYAAEQMAGESITNWYTQLQDMASKVMKKIPL